MAASIERPDVDQLRNGANKALLTYNLTADGQVEGERRRSNIMIEQLKLPEPPHFSDEQMQKCRKSGDYRSILFEWYKFVMHICVIFARIDRKSPAVREISPVQFAILTGLLNRSARLMLANTALAHKGRFGETIALLDRCIFESCLKVQWLCHKDSDESFMRYLASGLKTEIELESEVKGNIEKREGGKVLNIEKRMLKSIDRHINAAGLNREDVIKAKKLPDSSAMLHDLGHERLMYVVSQRVGSHHIHGTWPSLLFHYLEVNDDGSFFLRDHDCDTHPNQFIMTPLQVLETVRSFIVYIIESNEESKTIIGLLDSFRQNILDINSEMVGSDFESE
jgi:hypothetical protein